MADNVCVCICLSVCLSVGEPGSQYADVWRFVGVCEAFARCRCSHFCYTTVFVLFFCFGSGCTAVLAVNVVIGLYVLSAWKEEDEKQVAPPVGRFATKKEQ